MRTRTRLKARTILLAIGWLLSAVPSLVARASEPQGSSHGSHRQSLGRFVIADFDGDHSPDFATVHIDQTFIPLTNYSIHFELSQGLESEIGLTAPSGGLQLVTRDVNGDDSLDLVVRTALSSNLVAVFLNDGHGRFTLAKPEFFRSAQNEPSRRLNPPRLHRLERAMLLPSRPSSGDAADSPFGGRIRTTGERFPAQQRVSFRGFLGCSLSGRAPPSLS